MLSKKLYHIIISKVLILCLITSILTYCIIKNNTEAILLLAVLLLILIVQFIIYLNKTNKKIAYFFSAIKNEDSTLYFTENAKNTPTKELNQHLNRVNKIIQQIKLKNKAQDQYYKTIIERAQIGILTINSQNHILFANSTVKKLFNYPSLTHIQQLNKVSAPLFNLLAPLQPFSNKIVKLANERETKLLTLNATHIKLEDEPILLVVATNIKNELDNKEIESWIKLTKVLTHEIMNSIAPINSISETLYETLEANKEKLQNSDKEIINTTINGLQTIKEQTKVLNDFVVSYRSFSGISQPKKQLILIDELFDTINTLFTSEFTEKNIRFTSNFNAAYNQLFADVNQINQVLFNLVKNAVESFDANADNKTITLTSFLNSNKRLVIAVKDNGTGISNEQLDEIFVPFFSTKQEGSGVGLSLSKHIMKIHGGMLTVSSVVDKGTVFTLTF